MAGQSLGAWSDLSSFFLRRHPPVTDRVSG
jgi:hypothetical protein